MNMDMTSMKKIVKDAGAALSRVVQLTEEKLGTSEKTELDGHFENLWDRAENTKNYTEKIVRNAEAVLIPNPGNRIEDYIYEKIEKKRPSRLSNLEYLGLDMIEAGGAFGPGTAYGSALIKVGQWEQKLGQNERDFIGSAGMCFTQPLRKFLETEMRTIIKEKNLLETKRLDLDACKNRVRKARSMLGQPSAERDLRIAQSEFDRQAEITKLLLEGVSSSHAAHLRCLHEFVDAQATFYAQCTTIMTDLQRELASSVKPGPVLRLNSEDLEPLTKTHASYDAEDSFTPYVQSPPTSHESQHNDTERPQNENMQKAKVLYDYEPHDETELTLKANEIIFVRDISNSDYYIGCRGNNEGKVPKAFVEILT